MADLVQKFHLSGSRSIFICILAAQLALTACAPESVSETALSIPPEKLPQRLAVQKRHRLPPAGTFRIADLDGDGYDEIINITAQMDSASRTPAHVTYSDLEHIRAGAQLNFSGLINATVFNWDQDEKMELFVDEQSGDDLLLHVFDHRGSRLALFTLLRDAPEAADPVWRCVARPAGLIDGNRDGRPDLLIIISTNEAYQPRLLKLLDIRTGRTIWDYYGGTVIEQIFVADANLDGEEEIYLKTNAPGNGVGQPVNGTDDGRSWFIILSAAGAPLIVNAMGGEFSSFIAVPHDMDHDGRPEVALIKMSRNKNFPEKSTIAFWDPVGKRFLHQKEYDAYLNDRFAFLDVNGDGIDELIVFWGDGRIEARDQSNHITQETSIGEIFSGDPLVEDLDNDGEQELLIAGRSRIYLFSQQLRLQASYPVDFAVAGRAMVGRGNPKWIIASNRDERLLFQARTNYEAPVKVAWPLILAFALGGAAATLLVMARRQQRYRDPKRWAPGAIYHHLDAGLMLLDAAGQVVSINDWLRRRLNLTDTPLFPTRPDTLFTGPQFAPLHEWIEKSPLSAQRQPLLLEKAIGATDMQVTMRSLRDDNGRRRGSMIIFEDVTSQSQSSRALAWAQLAQRLAHQIKTPLSSVLLAVQRLQMEYQRDGSAKAGVYDRYIDYVADEVARIRKITDGFLKLAQSDKPRLAPVNLNLVISSVLEQYSPSLTPGQEIITDLEEDLPEVWLDEQQIRMALAILIENSLAAMEEKGQITFTTRLLQSLAGKENGESAESLIVECADTGRGIPAEALPRLFDPFFTTKTGGTGLGLPIAKKIIEEHQGSIGIQSQPGIGTVVTLTLPVK